MPEKDVNVNVNLNLSKGQELEAKLDPEFEIMRAEARRIDAELDLKLRSAQLAEWNVGKFRPLEVELRSYESAVRANPACTYVNGVDRYLKIQEIERKFAELRQEEEDVLKAETHRTVAERKSSELRQSKLKNIGDKLDEIRNFETYYSKCMLNAIVREQRRRQTRTLLKFAIPGVALVLAIEAYQFGRSVYRKHVDIGYAVDKAFAVGEHDGRKFAFDNEKTQKEFVEYARKLLDAPQPNIPGWLPPKNVISRYTIQPPFDSLAGLKMAVDRTEPLLAELAEKLGEKMDLPEFHNPGVISGRELAEARARQPEYVGFVGKYFNTKGTRLHQQTRHYLP